MLTQQTLRNIREAYVADIERDDPPSIPSLCRAHDAGEEAEIKQVRRLASRENWEAHRQKRKTKFLTALASREDALIDRLATEMITKRETFLRKAISEVESLLPIALEELRARIETGFFDDKALVQAIKLLIESRKSVIEIIQREFHHQDKQKDKQIDRELGIMRDLGLLSKVADAIEGKLNAQMMENGQFEVISAQDERHREALSILDAEVINEG
jgi:hypothetical protein